MARSASESEYLTAPIWTYRGTSIQGEVDCRCGVRLLPGVDRRWSRRSEAVHWRAPAAIGGVGLRAGATGLAVAFGVCADGRPVVRRTRLIGSRAAGGRG